MRIIPKSGTVGVISCTLMVLTASGKSLDPSATDAPAPALGMTNQSARLRPQAAAVRLTPRIAEIVRMVKAGLDHEVIKAYINGSNKPFNPSAADIVVLKRLETPQDLITVMLERDGELQKTAQRNSGPIASGALSSPRPMGYPQPNVPYLGPFAAQPNYAYAPVRRLAPMFFGPMTSFNNSYPTFINGQPVYSGYYVPGFGF